MAPVGEHSSNVLGPVGPPLPPAHSLLLLGSFAVVAYALAFGTGTWLVQALAMPWRRAAGAHWTERARLAYAPNFASLLLPALLVPTLACLAGFGPEIVEPRSDLRTASFWTSLATAGLGALTVRYRWLRQSWARRVTVPSWLAGCLIVLLSLAPQVSVMGLVALIMPEKPDWRAAVIFGAGVLVMAFFAWNGELAILRWLRVAKPAPSFLTEMVQDLGKRMNIPGRIKVLTLNWPSVNAVAWVGIPAVGFSHALLNALTEDELRAVAAHEVAHLGESGRVRAGRKLHQFAYLAVPPIFNYGGGAAGQIAGILLVAAIFLAYTRFSRRQEQRADRLEREATDASAYSRSMVKIHEANLAPAVMPGKQTHPHLYDRLLAGGIQPDFPRPLPPSRAKPFGAVLGAIVLAVVLMSAIIVGTGVAMQLWRR